MSETQHLEIPFDTQMEEMMNKSIIKENGNKLLSELDFDLHLACLNLQLNRVHYLLENTDADINSVDRWGNTPLIRACRSFPNLKLVFNFEHKKIAPTKIQNLRIELIELLLKSGAKLNVKDNEGNTPIHLVSKIRPREPKTLKFITSKAKDIQKLKRGEKRKDLPPTSSYLLK